MPCAVWRASNRLAAPKKGRDETRRRRRIQLGRTARFEQASQIHHADAIGHRERFFLIVRDEHGRDVEFTLNLSNRAPQLLADLGIECTEGFVEQQHLRLVRQCARHCNALLLTARQLRRQPIVHPFERHQSQQLLAASAAIGCLGATHAQGKLDVVAHRHVLEQRVVLEHQTDAALARRDMRNVVPVQCNSAVVHAGQARR